MLQIHFPDITRWQTKFNKNAMPEMQKKNQLKKNKNKIKITEIRRSCLKL